MNVDSFYFCETDLLLSNNLMSWSQPLTKRVVEGETDEMLWQVDIYLDTAGHIECADLTVSDGSDTVTVKNVITQKANRISQTLDDLHLDPEIKANMEQDILEGISSYGINPYSTERVFGM